MTKTIATAIIFGAALAASAAHAGTWYFGFGYEYDKLKSSGAQRAASYPFGGEIRAGWEYQQFLAIEGRFRIGHGEDGATHSKIISPSFGVVIAEPDYLSKWVYATAGVTYIRITSNQLVTAKDVTTYVPQPTQSQTTWFVGGGIRNSGKGYFVPRIEVGYRGSDLGGVYIGAGLDLRIP
jgi:hypothetical protein